MPQKEDIKAGRKNDPAAFYVPLERCNPPQLKQASFALKTAALERVDVALVRAIRPQAGRARQYLSIYHRSNFSIYSQPTNRLATFPCDSEGAVDRPKTKVSNSEDSTFSSKCDSTCFHPLHLATKLVYMLAHLVQSSKSRAGSTEEKLQPKEQGKGPRAEKERQGGRGEGGCRSILEGTQRHHVCEQIRRACISNAVTLCRK